MTFRELLQSSKPIILDGAMGTELEKRGFKGIWENNLTNPKAVIQVHEDYVKAGSMAVITNTLTMNRIFMESHKLEMDVARVNREGAHLAKKAVKNNGYVLGNLSSTGQLLEPYGTVSKQAATESFKEQAGYLAEGGVDGFIIETMIDLREALCASKACKGISSLPVLACVSFDTEKNGGRTAMGNSAEECANALTNAGADAIGANCGRIDPDQMAEIIGILSASTRVPIIAEPNAGIPKIVSGKTVFDMAPQAFALGMVRCLRAGARILGGCCGTSPEHIKAMVDNLKGIAAAPQ